MTSLTLLTPSFAGDLPQLQLMRESMAVLGIEIEHVVVAHTEDIAELRAALGKQRDLHVVPTSEVLDPRWERVRRSSRRRVFRAARDRLGRETLSGWWSQQVVKLGVGRALGLDRWLCLDSDVVFLRPLQAADVHCADDGRLDLQEWKGFGVGQRVRDRHEEAGAFLGLSSTQLSQATYVGAPVPMHGDVVDRLLTRLDPRGDWQSSFVANGLTEYPLYGLWARHLDPGEDVVPVDRRLCVHVYDPELAGLPDVLTQAIQDGAHMAMVHSRMGVVPHDYAPVLRAHWEDR